MVKGVEFSSRKKWEQFYPSSWPFKIMYNNGLKPEKSVYMQLKTFHSSQINSNPGLTLSKCLNEERPNDLLFTGQFWAWCMSSAHTYHKSKSWLTAFYPSVSRTKMVIFFVSCKKRMLNQFVLTSFTNLTKQIWDTVLVPTKW